MTFLVKPAALRAYAAALTESRSASQAAST
jgi:hypothetical protein